MHASGGRWDRERGRPDDLIGPDPQKLDQDPGQQPVRFDVGAGDAGWVSCFPANRAGIDWVWRLAQTLIGASGDGKTTDQDANSNRGCEAELPPDCQQTAHF